MAGFLIPSWYKEAVPTLDDLLIASIIWGFTLASGLFAGAKAAQQTTTLWKRSRRIQPYAVMVWAEWTSSTVIGVLSWLFIRGIVRASFWVYFAFLCLWIIQIQCICGIIVNRIALLMVDRRMAAKIKWSVAIILGLINISVFCIWIPARLQISTTFVYVNEIWDRIEKVLFLFVDAALNFYFIYLVRTKLIACGLTKYMPLFKFNMFMVGVSMSLDIILIGSMSIPNGIIYVQFHPLVYMLKLHIEMNIADLIVKVVRASNDHPSYADGTELRSRQNREETAKEQAKSNNRQQPMDPFPINRNYIETSPEGAQKRYSGHGITKMVQTKVISRRRDEENDEDKSSQSSTRKLKNDHQQDQF